MARRVMPASASITTVCKPARAVKVAALAPAGPPPTIATSYIENLLSRLIWVRAVQHARAAETSRRPTCARSDFSRHSLSNDAAADCAVSGGSRAEQLLERAFGPDAGHFALVGGGAAQ